MKTFLEHVAQDIISKYGKNLARTAIIFPNKRARLFFNEHLASHVEGPMWSPAYLTISEMFRRHTHLVTADPIKLICDLHKSYVSITGSKESLDHFYSWGQIMLSDFDDIDKNMADARQVFKNLEDIHELDDLSYLTEEQQEMLKRFFSNFSIDKSTELKQRFLRLWCHFHDIYIDYKHRLFSQNLSYEGALYRQVAEDDNIEFDYDRYIFVGFNLLQRVEQQMFTRLKKQGKAVFYWDFDHYYMQGKGSFNEAGQYISSYLADYPNELDNNNNDIYNCFSSSKHITYISAPTENVQAVFAGKWLREGDRIADGKKTAIVMCNEALLQSIVHNIPEEADKINITTGYPLSQSPFCSFVSMFIELRTDGYVSQRDRYRLRYVNKVLRHPYITYITENSHNMLEDINVKSKLFFLSKETLCTDKGLCLLFGDMDTGDQSFPGKILLRLTEILKYIAGNAKDNNDSFLQESLFRIYTILNRLYGLISSGDLNVDITTLRRLLRQILQTTSIPFHGEPAEGVQFMGVLETRNIDFDHILILSCNEGNMPKGVNDTSFIPYAIRKAYGLTTIDNKVSIYAYYFYRLLQRPTDITIVYNDSTDGMSTGEMSRFMLQIMLESNHAISRQSIMSECVNRSREPLDVMKTPEIMTTLRRRFDRAFNLEATRPLLTPTSINSYLRCQLVFYYTYVLGLRDNTDNDDETIDNMQFGIIFHSASQKIYERIRNEYGNVVERNTLEKFYHADAYLLGVVEETLDETMYNISNHTASKPDYNGLQLINIKVITNYLKQLLKADMDKAPFTLVGLEKNVVEDIVVKMGDSGEQFLSTIGGVIDRIDYLSAESTPHIRVLDYKTGGGSMKYAPSSVADIFNDANIDSHSNYYLQTILYSNIVRHSPQYNPQSLPVSPGLIFIQRNLKGSPILHFDKKPIADVLPLEEEFNDNRDRLLSDIFNPALPFKPTAHRKRCDNCLFRSLCY